VRARRALWEQHLPLLHAEDVADVLGQNDLYARMALQDLPQHAQLDLLCWAEAHMILRAISDGGLLANFAAKAPASWKALRSLTKLAVECGFTDEARFRLLVEPAELRRTLATAEPSANKLLRLLQGGGGDAKYSGSYHDSAPRVGMHLGAVEGRRTRLDERNSGEEAEKDVGRVRIVRIRWGAHVAEHELDWEEIADCQRRHSIDVASYSGSYSPPRDRKGGYAGQSRPAKQHHRRG